jgi:Domain of unknown function (DUF4380)
MKHTALIAVVWLGSCMIALTPSFGAEKFSFDAGRDPTSTHHGLLIIEGDFHGWNAIMIRSKRAEVAVVPGIGRVMRFSLTSSQSEPREEPSEPFWNNPKISKEMQPDSEGWTNFGGDKAWPAPQSDWPKIEGQGWPPPKPFDAMPCRAVIQGDRIQLTSPIDPAYGVRMVRTISLDSQKPVMTIKTTYEKVQGSPVRVGVWTITQLDSPERAFILLPEHSAFPQGYNSFLPASPKDLQVDGRLVSMTRDPENKTMIGNDGEALLWVGNGPDLLIKNENPERAGEWPEQGSHAKIYTNSGQEMKYVEFELLNPLRDLKPGESSTMSSTYTLIPRTEREPLREAKHIFGVN